MGNVALLLDKAKNSVSPANYSVLAARLGVSRQSVWQWKTGAAPLPDDRIAQIARIARVDAGEWLVAIHADQSTGDARKGLQSVLRRLGVAAMHIM
ncbi:MAG: helix-turn-helix domain-containing protein [Chloroflexota bacterium]|nr:helix-turn-helix domain-containing protein [Chloroflexota bacterium]